MKKSRTAGPSFVVASFAPARGAAEKTLPARAKVPLLAALSVRLAHKLDETFHESERA